MNVIESVIRQDNLEDSERAIGSILPSYYSKINKPVVFDREKNWSNSGNLEMIKRYINPNPKIVVTVRPVLDILASLVKIYGETPRLHEEMTRDGWWFKENLTYEDNVCDYLMRPWGNLDSAFYNLNSLNLPENKDIFHVVEYDDLMSKPEDVMKSLYTFIGLDQYNHDYSNIFKEYVDHDDRLGFSNKMHEVRPKLSRTSPPAKEVLSDYVINKYSNLEHWSKK
jgi:sulfotransferase